MTEQAAVNETANHDGGEARIDRSLLPFMAPARDLDAAAPLRWLRLGWADLLHAPRQSLAYGAVILSFLGGIRWGAALRGIGASQRRFDFAISVIPSLAGWAALLIPA